MGPCRCGYDDELRRHNEVLRRACDVQPGDHVLDIGCGSGQTTCETASLARAGSALGVDISATAVKRARERARARGLRNVTFECADAQVHPFPAAGFDLATSRFGVMFFRDPAAAFANIARALRLGGRLVMMVWQASERNEWEVAISHSLSGGGESGVGGPAVAPSTGQDAFSLADPPAVTGLLQAAGFADITFTDVREPVYYGPDVATALDWVCGFASTRSVLERLDSAVTARALQRLGEVLASRMDDTGVWFGSRAWIIAARRRLAVLCGDLCRGEISLR
jgi:SAM-dependent methyltransferase